MDRYWRQITALQKICHVINHSEHVELCFTVYPGYVPCDRCNNLATWTSPDNIFLCDKHYKPFELCFRTKPHAKYKVCLADVQQDLAVCMLALEAKNCYVTIVICPVCRKTTIANGQFIVQSLCDTCANCAIKNVEAIKVQTCDSQRQKLALCCKAGLLVRDIWPHMYLVWLAKNDFCWDALNYPMKQD